MLKRMDQRNFSEPVARQVTNGFHQAWMHVARSDGLVERNQLIQVIECFADALKLPLDRIMSPEDIKEMEGEGLEKSNLYLEDEFYRLYQEITGKHFDEILLDDRSSHEEDNYQFESIKNSSHQGASGILQNVSESEDSMEELDRSPQVFGARTDPKPSGFSRPRPPKWRKSSGDQGQEQPPPRPLSFSTPLPGRIISTTVDMDKEPAQDGVVQGDFASRRRGSPIHLRQIKEQEATIVEYETRIQQVEREKDDMQKLLSSIQMQLRKLMSDNGQKEKHIQALESQLVDTHTSNRTSSPPKRLGSSPLLSPQNIVSFDTSSSSQQETADRLTKQLDDLRQENAGYLTSITRIINEKRDMQKQLDLLNDRLEVESKVFDNFGIGTEQQKSNFNLGQQLLALVYRHQTVMKRINDGTIALEPSINIRGLMIFGIFLLLFVFVIGQIRGIFVVQSRVSCQPDGKWWNGTLSEKYIDAFDIWVTKTLNRWGGYSDLEIHVS